MGAIIRLAELRDAEDIRAIYRPYVEQTAISFEYETPSQEAFLERMRHILEAYPFLVCDVDGQIAGYAYAQRHKERSAYQWNAELTVYLSSRHIGRGMGKALYGALMEILALQNVRNVYGLVTVPNPQSQRLHETMGFCLAGTNPKTGYKQKQWHDVACYEKAIGKHETPPAVFVPFALLEPAMYGGILRRYAGEILTSTV